MSNSNVIPFPVVNKRTGQSPTLGELTRKAEVKVERVSQKVIEKLTRWMR